MDATIDPRLTELLERLVAPGDPRSTFSGSEFRELHDLTYEVIGRLSLCRTPHKQLAADAGETCAIMLLEQFMAGVKHDTLTDDDGYGHYVAYTHINDQHVVLPSKIAAGELPPAWVTHVAWYNR